MSRPTASLEIPRSDLALLVDGAVIVSVSFAICFVSDQLTLMTILVPSLMLARMFFWARLVNDRQGRGLMQESIFLAICAGLGAFNDFNSVVRHRIYDYRVPHYFPKLTTIPIWMLLYWGQILRFLFQLSQWHRLGEASPNRTFLGRKALESAALKVGIQLLLVVATRQSIYRLYLDPIFSWLPFAIALVLFIVFFRLSVRDRWLLLIMTLGGPLIEILYIQMGSLHYYHLGWLGGVPLWIATWWMLGILVWADVSPRIWRVIGRLSRVSDNANHPGVAV
jgi:hypothetical protein